MTEEEIKDMFNRADLDDDGFVTQDDFYNMMTHRVYWDNMWFCYGLRLNSILSIEGIEFESELRGILLEVLELSDEGFFDLLLVQIV